MCNIINVYMKQKILFIITGYQKKNFFGVNDKNFIDVIIVDAGGA